MSTEMAPGSNALSFIFSPRVAKRRLAIAGIVGCLLSLTNQGDVLLQEGISARVGIKILMNFIIPFSVSSVSALLNRNSS